MDTLDTFITEVVQKHFNYIAYVVLMMIGLWGLIAKRNLIKKLIGMSIFQTAIILFYVSLGYKSGDDPKIPIYVKESKSAVTSHDKGGYKTKTSEGVKAVAHGDASEKHAPHGSHGAKKSIETDKYANPLPHVLMLTAIVVGVATLGVALAVAQLIFKDFGTLEEHELLEKIKSGDYNHD